MRTTFAAFLIAALVAACQKERSAAAEEFQDDFAPMNAAYEEARSSVGKFIAILEAGRLPGHRYLVKARVAADGEVEHVWLEPIELEQEVFSGPIINEFAVIQSIKAGDRWSVSKDEISDWAILDAHDKLVAGGRTLEVMEAEVGNTP